MGQLSLKEIQKIQLDILKDVATICNKNELRYFLAAGTLLGAVRHAGFIPWDDDIDLIVPRPDYEKFLSIYPEQGSKNFELSCLENNKNHQFTYAKIFDKRTEKIEEGISYKDKNYPGIDIDIFPIDGLPTSMELSNKYFKKQENLYKLYSLITANFKQMTSAKEKLLYLAGKVFSRKNILKYSSYLAQKYPFDDSQYVAVSVAAYLGTYKERIEKNKLLETIQLPFEDETFSATAAYDEYLTNVYGDYMQLPPENERTTHHRYVARRKSNVSS